MNLFNNKQKGQAFESFRLLIAFVLAAATLAIIMSMVNMTQEQSIVVSTEKFKEGIISASKSTGVSAQVPFVISDLIMRGYIDKKYINNITGLKEDCISFQEGPGLEKINNNRLKILGDHIKMDVTVYCNFNYVSLPNDIETIYYDDIDGGCQTFCILFFNKKPPTGTYPEQ